MFLEMGYSPCKMWVPYFAIKSAFDGLAFVLELGQCNSESWRIMQKSVDMRDQICYTINARY